ncbi:ergothioneine biosynthesis protein EgtB [Acidihalobacter ferrooxydans]|uniref:Sulfatase maturase n=1 Tax=Acidihalobacter ferrooxydans TaxID=1765967 RepID=A0A1P8UFY1_9GAMM|nr:ergothioneine biosynthesis protein EgtB [Acidihalobacter ferrooxydans]APZ42725.1 hypothetical protein BW247_06135 [Acidihalobacter ferrooxydans]
MDNSSLHLRYQSIRDRSVALTHPLSPEDCCAQSMMEASPAKWHLAHTTWFFETFVLEPSEKRFKPYNRAYRELFNSYYNGVGDQYPRPNRGLLTRPSMEEVLAYRSVVDQCVLDLIDKDALDAKQRALMTLGLNHEQQHQELLLTDIKHLFSFNPLDPVYDDSQHSVGQNPPPPMTWMSYSGGLTKIGYDGDEFCFDNELPLHLSYLHDYQLASRLITNGEYLDFMEDGGYENPLLWLAEGWDWRQRHALTHPLYWCWKDGAWFEFTLHGLIPLDMFSPVVHVSYYEADAYTRWSEARLPTEIEWEHAAKYHPVEGHLAESGLFHPRTVQDSGSHQFFGDTWEWTQSSYSPYPGYRIGIGAVGEYNGKFMVNQYVLRGGSCVTPSSHIRPSYRNFFPADARWQFSGIRLAKMPD